MQTVEIPLSGQSATHRSLPLTSQVTRNWWPEIELDGKTVRALMPTWGAKLFSAGSPGTERGLADFKGVMYKVSGTSLEKVDTAGTRTTIGTISGTARCSFVTNGDTLVIVTGGTVYSYDGTTLTAATDVDFESPDYVAYLNNQANYDGTGARWAVSDAGALTTINSLNYGTAEAQGDNLVRPYVMNHLLYLFGEKSTEPWFNSGIDNPPFDRLEGGSMSIGLGAGWSVANNESLIYFLGHDRNVYRLAGTEAQRLQHVPLSQAIKGYSTVTDAIGFCFTWDAQNFYALTFPTANKTWVYAEASNEWFEMSSDVDGGRHIANSYLYIYGKHIIADYQNGDLYEWDPDTYTDNGATIRRVRQTGVIDGAFFGAQYIGKPLFMGSLELILNPGKGLATGQGSDPQVMLQWSDDGGRTWSNEVWRSAGAIGEYTWRVEWHGLGSFFNRILRIAVSDPIPWELYRLTANIEAGI